MGYRVLQGFPAAVWHLAEHQHGVVARRQLLELGLSAQAVKHRVTIGRLHPIRRGVYAIGRPGVTRHGVWTAAVLSCGPDAVLSCGPDAVLSHASAAALWEIRPPRSRQVHLSVPQHVVRYGHGITVHRRMLRTADLARHHGIPVTSPACTLLDLATGLRRDRLEAAINEADKRDLIDPESLRRMLGGFAGRPGAPALRDTLDARTFTLTDSELERRFLPIARRAGLPRPETGTWVNGFKVDFHWPALGLVVETDGLRYHRTPAQQTRDRLRDQAHSAAGLTPLRFTHAQVAFESGRVEATLSAVAKRLAAGR